MTLKVGENSEMVSLGHQTFKKYWQPPVLSLSLIVDAPLWYQFENPLWSFRKFDLLS